MPSHLLVFLLVYAKMIINAETPMRIPVSMDMAMLEVMGVIVPVRPRMKRMLKRQEPTV